jgi:hypothetical protein
MQDRVQGDARALELLVSLKKFVTIKPVAVFQVLQAVILGFGGAAQLLFELFDIKRLSLPVCLLCCTISLSPIVARTS